MNQNYPSEALNLARRESISVSRWFQCEIKEVAHPNSISNNIEVKYNLVFEAI